MYLVYEYLERGSLGKVLYGEEGGSKLDWAKRVKVVQGVAHALAYLHHDRSPPIVHRDISVNNILLESDFEPRVSDFGTAKLLNPGSSNWTSVAGSYGYMAPGDNNDSLCTSSILSHPLLTCTRMSTIKVLVQVINPNETSAFFSLQNWLTQ